MALADRKPVSRKYVWAHMADSSSPSSAFAASPCKGMVIKAGSVTYNAITGANSNFTFEINNVATTGLAWVLTQVASAAGDVDFAFPTTNSNTLARVKENDTIEWVSDGAGTTTAPTMCWAEIEMD